MAKYKLRKPAMGIDQLSDETSLLVNDNQRTTTLREGTNIDLDAEGNISRRGGYVRKLSGSGYHSLHETKRGWLMLCHNEDLGIYDSVNNQLAVLASMDEAYLTSFTELNGNIYYVNIGAKGMIRSGETTVRNLGVQLPDATPSFTATTNGSFPAGTYGIAYTIVNELGEESPLGPLVVVTLAERGGIQGGLFTVVSGYKYRIYMTTTDGEELYQAVEFDADTTAYHIADHEEGRRPDTQFLSLLPNGYIIRAHGSRLYVATTDFVFFSEPFLPHLTNAANGFIPTTGFTTMVQPVDGGLYISDSAGVRFYTGDDPSTFQVRDVSTEPAIFGTAVAVPGEYLPAEIGEADMAAVWLTQSGYQVGLSSGKLVRLNSKQVRLPKYTQGCAALSIQNGRKQLVTPVNSNELADASVALDSTIS